MSDEIEGKVVEPHLLRAIEKPHLVPAELMDFWHTRPNLIGYTEEFIIYYKVGQIVREIRKLAGNILDSSLRKKHPYQDNTCDAKIFQFLGREITILRGVKTGTDVMRAEIRVLLYY